MSKMKSDLRRVRSHSRFQPNVSDAQGAAPRARSGLSVHRLHGPDPLRRQAVPLRVPQLAVDGRRRRGSSAFDRAGKTAHCRRVSQKYSWMFFFEKKVESYLAYEKYIEI